MGTYTEHEQRELDQEFDRIDDLRRRQKELREQYRIHGPKTEIVAELEDIHEALKAKGVER